MPAEARRIRIFSVGGAERILFRRDIGEKAEFRAARRQGVDQRVAIVDALADLGEENEHRAVGTHRSEEHTSELQSLMRISYAVFCLKKKKSHNNQPE